MAEKEFRDKQIFPEGKELVTVSGAMGSTQQDGTIVAHLYSEYKTVASLHTHHPAEDGTVDYRQVESRETDSEVTRVFHSSISLSPQVAKQFAVWLIERAQEADKLFSGQDEEETHERDSTN